MYEITVRSAFEAAHFISGYDGKCARLHGHNWQVEAIVRGRELDELGMLIDFKIIKAALKKILDDFDHRFLNELETFAQENPTAENLARKIFEQLAASNIFSGSTKLHAVKVYESPNSCVAYSADE
ncbi:MAG: 6-carboxytetrahydropterin synthase QueD [Selenomonadaceae bacterium]|nr:6-carboxytetrahydropterin synthase QueD [Selenomonadaceae bacterium]